MVPVPVEGAEEVPIACGSSRCASRRSKVRGQICHHTVADAGSRGVCFGLHEYCRCLSPPPAAVGGAGAFAASYTVQYVWLSYTGAAYAGCPASGLQMLLSEVSVSAGARFCIPGWHPLPRSGTGCAGSGRTHMPHTHTPVLSPCTQTASQVFSDGQNLALRKPAFMKMSASATVTADKAVDGDRTNFAQCSDATGALAVSWPRRGCVWLRREEVPPPLGSPKDLAGRILQSVASRPLPLTFLTNASPGCWWYVDLQAGVDLQVGPACRACPTP
jgi:hypothetical protein